MTIEQRVQSLAVFWQDWWPAGDVAQMRNDVCQRAARVINECGLTDIHVYDDGAVCLVFSAHMGEQTVVTKIVPTPEPSPQVQAMTVWQKADISPRLFYVFDNDRTMVMEHLAPGVSLRDSDINIQAKLVIAGKLARQMHKAPVADTGYCFPTMSGRVQGNHGLQILNSNINARMTLEHLLRGGQRALTHGDLHFGNILLGARGWQMIDGHAILADPCSEISPLVDSAIFLPDDESDDSNLIDSWITSYCGSGGLDEERVRQWLLVQLSIMIAQSRGTQSAKGKLWRKKFLRMVKVLS